MSAGNLMIVQGGGPTAVFNASLASVISEASGQPGFGKIYGARSGTKGLVGGDVIDLTSLSLEQLRKLRETPGAALGSSRFSPADDDMQRMVEHLRWLDVRRLIFIGGNGTMRGAQLVSGVCRTADYEVQVVGVPKTVDNDIAVTDRCPGYASAARYIAQSTRDLGMDLRGLPQPVTVLETMGRSVGWLAAAATLAKSAEDDAPHLVYLPETPFRKEQFLSALDNIVRRQGWAVVVVSEGARNEDGSMVYAMNDPSHMDPLKRPMTGGVGQFLAGMVGENLKIRCRSEKPGLLGRSSIALASAQDQRDAALTGRAAVKALLAGETEKMVSLLPLSQERQYDLVPLHAVGGHERTIPAEWLNEGPLAVTNAFTQYAAPLVGELYSYSAPFPRGI
jgi:6-phosphofructokinase